MKGVNQTKGVLGAQERKHLSKVAEARRGSRHSRQLREHSCTAAASAEGVGLTGPAAPTAPSSGRDSPARHRTHASLLPQLPQFPPLQDWEGPITMSAIPSSPTPTDSLSILTKPAPDTLVSPGPCLPVPQTGVARACRTKQALCSILYKLSNDD